MASIESLKVHWESICSYIMTEPDPFDVGKEYPYVVESCMVVPIDGDPFLRVRVRELPRFFRIGLPKYDEADLSRIIGTTRTFLREELEGLKKIEDALIKKSQEETEEEEGGWIQRSWEL